MLITLAALVSSAFILPLPHTYRHSCHRLDLCGLQAAEKEINLNDLKYEIFNDLFCKGGESVQNGDMGGALGYFTKALEIDPDNEQTKKMVARLKAVGVVSIDVDAKDSDASS